VTTDDAVKRVAGNDPAARVAEFWGSPEREVTGLSWTEIPRVAANINRRATGDPGIHWITHSEQFMGALPKPRRALSLGSGTGVVERAVRERDVCQRIDGLDVAEGAVARARGLARESGVTGVEYRVADLNRDELPPEAYDVVYAHAVLHHIFALEHVLDQIRRTLKPGGVLVLYEYVGPAQMQFPREHLELADALLGAIPPRYRRHVRAGLDGTKDSAPRLSLAEMNATDPSEGIRASEIITLAASRFELRHVRPIGGTLLVLIFNEIAANFRDDDPEAQAIVDALVHVENVLIDSGVLPSYHAYAVCEKTDSALPAQTHGLAGWRSACTLPTRDEPSRLPTRQVTQVITRDLPAVTEERRTAASEGHISFLCNICSARSTASTTELGREEPSCKACGSTVRNRAIIHALSFALFGASVPLDDFPARPDITGLGLSDWHEYASRLADKFGYENTFFDRSPQLDITDVPDERRGRYDFVIASEVFEHVASPVSDALANTYRLLKPRGVLILSVPYSLDGETTEHFPELHRYKLVVVAGQKVLLNRTPDGRWQVFEDLVFHGGDGATLEMRLFGRESLIRMLYAAGFEAVEVHDRDDPRFGIVFREPWSLPITARVKTDDAPVATSSSAVSSRL
jgi:2-polyprenyl-3-methyl-5-hydroxy-6-metoxy-1,4-benzoquinol methylase